MKKKQKTIMKIKANVKAKIILQPKIKKKLTEAEIYLLIVLSVFLISLTVYVMFNVLSAKNETKHPTMNEIKEYCENKGMQSNGYTINDHPKGALSLNQTAQIIIHCKANYTKTKTEEPACCYPETCSQAINNPKKCNCIYLIYCMKTKTNEETIWHYKITTP